MSTLPFVVVAAEPQSVVAKLNGMLSGLLDGALVLVGQIFSWSIGMAAVWFVLGGLGAYLAWRLFRARGWLDGPWEWCAKMRWIWAVLMIMAMSIGGCSSGIIWGAGMGAKQWVQKSGFFEKSTGHIYATLMIFRAEPGLDGNKTDELLEKDIAAAIAATRKAQDKAAELGAKAVEMESSVRERLDQWSNDQNISGIKKWMLGGVMNFFWEQQIKTPLNESEARALIKKVVDDNQAKDEREVARQAMDRVAKTFRTAAILYINEMIWPSLLVLIPLTLCAGFGPLCVFWTLRWLTIIGKESTPNASGEPPLAE